MTDVDAPDAAGTATASTRRLPLAEARALGKRHRDRTPRSNLARRSDAARDASGILDEQNSTRVPELLPLRRERMSESAFAFYRGTAAVMAADLAADPHSGIVVASCGDAHVANFGFYASPQRSLVFDLNDFDEAGWAPWEWDVKRLVTSIVVGGQSTSRDDDVIRTAALAATRAYARSMAAAVARSPLDRYFEHFDVDAAIAAMDPASRRVLRSAARDATRRTSNRAVRKLTETGPDGRLRFIERPPTMVRADPEIAATVVPMTREYETSTNVDIALLTSQYDPVDVCLRVVGVGSVGTRCYVVAFEDGDGHALILQAKEAVRSVLEQFGGIAQPRSLATIVERGGHGARVVALQRVLQGVSDPFLGHVQTGERDLYVRQFHDMKGGIDVATIDDAPFVRYAASCGVTLARAHSQSPRAAEVAGYIGNGRIVGESILEWSYAYAQTSRDDYAAYLDTPA